MGHDWSTVIDVLAGHIRRHYLFPEVAERACALLRRRLAEGVYASTADARALADLVSADLEAVGGDPHLFLAYSPEPLGPDEVIDEGAKARRRAELSGHGFARIEVLPGNIGVLDVRAFYSAESSAPAATAAMTLLAPTDALIIDLRENLGGEPDMAILLSSYVLDGPVHVFDLRFPVTGRTIQYRTHPVPGPRFGGRKPLWVLTSRRTFSGAEGFAHDLQQLGRATLVGETTAGAAYFGYSYRVDDHLWAGVPSGAPANAVSGGHWEGIGVRPDIAVAAPMAFDVAHRLALEHVLGLGADGERARVADAARAALAALSLGTS